MANARKFPGPFYLRVDEKGVLNLPSKLVNWIVVTYKLGKKTPRAQKMAIKKLIIEGIHRGYKAAGLPIPKKETRKKA